MKRIALLVALAALLIPGGVAASSTTDPSLLVVPDDIVLVAGPTGMSEPFDFYGYGQSMLRCQLDGPSGPIFELSAPVEALTEYGDVYAVAQYGQRGVQLPFDNTTTPQPAVYTGTCYQHSLVSYDPHLGNVVYTSEPTATGSFTITVLPPQATGSCPTAFALQWPGGSVSVDRNGDGYECWLTKNGRTVAKIDNRRP